MAHDHAHDPKTYYVEQLCTIGICGALGGIAVMLYVTDLLWFIAPKIQHWVLLGGIALLVLVAVRAVVVWFQAGKLPAEAHDQHHHHDHDHDHAHDHDHGHGETCAHDHAHDHDHGHGETCAHDHDHDHDHAHGHGHSHGGGDDHGHDHGWAPWRYAILLLPVALYFLGLPNIEMKQASARDRLNLDGLDVSASASGDTLGEIDFRQIAAAPYTAQSRKQYEGKTAVLRGEFLPGNDRMFTVVRYKMNCCSADRVPLPAAIVLDRDVKEKIPMGLEGHWVTAQGQLQFAQRPDQPDTWFTVLVLRPDAEHPLIDPEGKNDKALIKVVQRPSDYYLY